MRCRGAFLCDSNMSAAKLKWWETVIKLLQELGESSNKHSDAGDSSENAEFLRLADGFKGGLAEAGGSSTDRTWQEMLKNKVGGH